jgi:hypothetical protein
MLAFDIEMGQGSVGEAKPVGAAGIDVQRACDLRRRPRQEQVDVLLSRAKALSHADRLLLESVLGEGRTAVYVARLTSQAPRSIRRRAKRLIHRLSTPEFMFVLRERATWPTTRRRVADACVVEGTSMLQAARQLHLSFHMVRRQVEIIASSFEAATPGARWSAPVGFRREGVAPPAVNSAGARP